MIYWLPGPAGKVPILVFLATVKSGECLREAFSCAVIYMRFKCAFPTHTTAVWPFVRMILWLCVPAGELTTSGCSEKHPVVVVS
eukprot:COSAG02_NODE_38908_length_423_cov_0.953704_1_plen_83_part_01